MNKIQELLKNKFNIKEIKKVKLKDVADFSNGKGHEKVVEKDGKYILITSKAISTDMEQIRRTNLMLSPLFKDDITMVMSDLPNGKALAKCFIVDEDNKYTLNQRICSIKVKNKEIILPKFLYYYLNRNSQLLKYDDGTNQTNLKKDDIINIKIAVPPMEVQREIVRILDKFTLYSAVLSAELIARKKQHQYYVDKLFDLDENIKVSLSEICTIERGGNFAKKHFTEIGIPAIHYGKIYTYYGLYTDSTLNYIDEEIAKKQKFANNNDIIMAITSENIKDVCKCVLWEGKKPVAVGGHTAILRHNQNARFLAYYFTSTHFQIQKESYCVGTKVIEMRPSNLEKILIPIPSLEEQKRIVDILDRFYMLTYDLTVGLPAEIETRQKQYEYYRDKLLSFD